MRSINRIIASAAILAAAASPAYAVSLDDMVGTWGWEGYTVEVTHCDATTVCAEVTDGPQNVGMQMLETTPEPVGKAFKAKVKHPATGESYFSKMTLSDGAWSMEGCTAAGTCAEGTFTRK